MADVMGISHSRHDGEHPYTCISNQAINDDRLSLGARGLHHLLLSKPDDWSVVIEWVIRQTPDGRRVVRAYLAELKRYGYIVSKGQTKSARGRFGHLDMDVYELPSDTDDRKRHTVRPGTTDKRPGGTDDRLPTTVSGRVQSNDLPTAVPAERPPPSGASANATAPSAANTAVNGVALVLGRFLNLSSTNGHRAELTDAGDLLLKAHPRVTAEELEKRTHRFYNEYPQMSRTLDNLLSEWPCLT
jgi:hypothetical protein